ncbi:MAG: hydrolase [Ilumatobacteraceae bacterium]|nr:hydrolase [Ilumatobacteraceae bacterium]
MPTDQFYFRQLLSGRDFATDDQIAQQMVNFVYAIGDRATGECVLVDPAYAVGELLDVVQADGMRCTGVLATHYHADHVGGSMMGYQIEGVAALLDRTDCPIHVQRQEAPWVMRTTGLGEAQLVQHDPGDVVSVGSIDITLVHTPGHTPGSQCFHVQGRLVSGDTLFLEGCGRTDLPGSNVEDMYHSLRSLATLADDTIVFPGHRYSQPSSATMGDIVQTNYVFKPTTVDAWMQWFGRS